MVLHNTAQNSSGNLPSYDPKKLVYIKYLKKLNTSYTSWHKTL